MQWKTDTTFIPSLNVFYLGFFFNNADTRVANMLLVETCLRRNMNVLAFRDCRSLMHHRLLLTAQDKVDLVKDVTVSHYSPSSRDPVLCLPEDLLQMVLNLLLLIADLLDFRQHAL
jgi:hypothetical protein